MAERSFCWHRGPNGERCIMAPRHFGDYHCNGRVDWPRTSQPITPTKSERKLRE